MMVRSVIIYAIARGVYLQSTTTVVLDPSVYSVYMLLGHFTGQWLISGFCDWIIKLVCSYKSVKTSCSVLLLSPSPLPHHSSTPSPVRDIQWNTEHNKILSVRSYLPTTATRKHPIPGPTVHPPASQSQSAFTLSPAYTIPPHSFPVSRF